MKKNNLIVIINLLISLGAIGIYQQQAFSQIPGNPQQQQIHAHPHAISQGIAQPATIQPRVHQAPAASHVQGIRTTPHVISPGIAQPAAIQSRFHQAPAASHVQGIRTTPRAISPGIAHPAAIHQQQINPRQNVSTQQGRQNWNGHRRHDWNRHDNSQFSNFYMILGVPYYFYSSPPAYYEGNEPDNDSYVTTTQPTPVNEQEYTNQLPNGVWVTANSGNVPDNAIAYSDQNGNTAYYCRAMYNNQLYYGELLPNDGCYAQDQSTLIRFTEYDVLVNSTYE